MRTATATALEVAGSDVTSRWRHGCLVRTMHWKVQHRPHRAWDEEDAKDGVGKEPAGDGAERAVRRGRIGLRRSI